MPMSNAAPRSPERLTEKEKECLRLWLAPATAKEIAIELGVSHHAVEKRLKSARAKLDVQTSLDAARILAAAERTGGYQPTASQSPDLASITSVDRNGPAIAAARAGTLGWNFRRSSLVSGVIVMSIILAAGLALALAEQATPASSQEGTSQQRVFVTRADIENGTLPKADLRKAFDRMDKDGSGFIESGEASNIRLSKVDSSKSGETTEQTGRSAVALFDDDKDGRVSYAEFENWFASSLSRAGAVAED